MFHGDVENNLDSKALCFSQLMALDAARVTTGTSPVAFESWFMANSHWCKPELPGGW